MLGVILHVGSGMSPLVSVVSLLLLLELCRGQRGHTAEERCTQPALVSIQYENCSKQLMASPLDFPSREITKQAAEAVLKPGMTFAFLGDSTMHQQVTWQMYGTISGVSCHFLCRLT